MRTTKKRLLAVAFLQLVATTIGATLALGAARSDAGVSAGLHCTRYAPSWLIRDSYNHADCRAVGTMYAWEGYYTNSYGWRDDNSIYLVSPQNWEIGMFDTGGNWYYWFVGNSQGTTTNGSNTVQLKAYCSTNTLTVNGRCYTNWYD
jgi:hypothetical protein